METLFCVCKSCNKVIGCSSDKGETIQFCSNCLFVEQCNPTIDKIFYGKKKAIILFIKYVDGCRGHRKFNEYENNK